MPKEVNQKPIFPKSECPLNYALSIIGGKWRLQIIWAIHKNEVVRYNELKKHVVGITNMMLAQSLKELESYGIVEREQFLEVPPRVEYRLTEHGLALIPALESLAKWGKKLKNESMRHQNEAKDEMSKMSCL